MDGAAVSSRSAAGFCTLRLVLLRVVRLAEGLAVLPVFLRAVLFLLVVLRLLLLAVFFFPADVVPFLLVPLAVERLRVVRLDVLFAVLPCSPPLDRVSSTLSSRLPPWPAPSSTEPKRFPNRSPAWGSFLLGRRVFLAICASLFKHRLAELRMPDAQYSGHAPLRKCPCQDLRVRSALFPHDSPDCLDP